MDLFAEVIDYLGYEQFVDFENRVLDDVKDKVYICSMCGEITWPQIELKDGKPSITTEKNELRGGKGNRIIKGNVCSECMRKLGK